MEYKLLEKFEQERTERKELEKRLINKVDEKYSLLLNELNKEINNKNESIDNFNFYLKVIYNKSD